MPIGGYLPKADIALTSRSYILDAKSIVSTALELARSRQAETPSFGIYASCVAQLEYLLSVVSRRAPIDRPKLRTIMVGYYGMREFEEADPDFSEALKHAQLIASNMADGLKPL